MTDSLSVMNPLPPYAAIIGLDWGNDEHAVCLLDTASGAVESKVLTQSAEALASWLTQLEARFSGHPVALCLEQSRGAVVNALLGCPWLVLYPLNPRSLSSYRVSRKVSGVKNDTTDAQLLCDYLAKHWDSLRPWRPDTVQVRQLALLVEDRRQVVELQVQAIQRLQAVLKSYFPQALQLAGDNLGSEMATDFLSRWATLQKLQKVLRSQPHILAGFYRKHNCRSQKKMQEREELALIAQPLTRDEAILQAGQMKTAMLVGQLKSLRTSLESYDREIARLFEEQEDAPFFKHLPGAGPQLAPRLLVALGTDRERWRSSHDLQAHSGIAPVTKQSGKSCYVHQRYACPKFLKQSFHEFALCSIRVSVWAKAFYALQRDRGKSHHMAVRALAYKWQRIIWRCWRDRRPYSEHHYLCALKKRQAPLCQFLPAC